MEGFDLYREAKNDFEKLVPEKLEGLILLSLYSQFGEGDFKEEDIIKAIETVYSDVKGNSLDRTEYTRNNRIILNFQDNFLWRDQFGRTYRFRSYGYEFFKAIHQRLQNSYNPAKIKRSFDELLNSLKREIDKDYKKGLSLWVEDQFIIRKDFLSQQIESLDQQVSRSVEDFKACIKKSSDDTDILSLLNEIEMRLDEIKSQALEMKHAFEATYDIDELLTDLATQSLENKVDLTAREEITKVHAFNKQVRANLEQVSNRIEKIKPRVRDFYSGFNRPDFERKSAKFLDYLLTHSRIINDGNKKNLSPPENVSLIQISEPDTCPQFMIIPNRVIEIKKPFKASNKIIDEQKRKEFLDKTKSSLFEKRRVKYWVNVAMNKIQKEKELDFSIFFFHILKNENRKLSIAVKTTQQVLKIIQKKPELTLNVEQSVYKDNDIENVEIWKAQIRQK